MADRVLRALAATAVVTVLLAAAVAGQRYAAREPAAAGPSKTAAPSVRVPSVSVPTPSVFPGGRIVFGYADRDAVYEIPSGWSPIRGVMGLEVDEDYEGLLPRAFDPASYGEGWCRGDPTQFRAYVGWGPPPQDAGLDVRRANREVLAPWRAGFTFDEGPAAVRPRATPARPVRLDDDTAGWLSTMTGAVHEEDCPSLRASEVVVLTFPNAAASEAEAAVTSVVGYREIGTGRDVTRAELVRILRTARGVDQ